MKKYLLLSLFVWAALAAPAQDLGVYKYSHTLSNPLRSLYHKITHYVASQEKLPWVLAVRRQTTRAVPMRFTGIKYDFLTPQPQPMLTGHATALADRLVTWKNILRHHLVLRNFTFKILQPDEVSTLSARQLDTVERFLQNGITAGSADLRYTPVKVEEFNHYLVRLTFQSKAHEKPFYLTANCYTRELFVSLRPNVLGIKLEPLSTRIHSYRP